MLAPPWALAHSQAEPLCHDVVLAYQRTNHQSFPYYPPMCLIIPDCTLLRFFAGTTIQTSRQRMVSCLLGHSAPAHLPSWSQAV